MDKSNRERSNTASSSLLASALDNPIGKGHNMGTASSQDHDHGHGLVVNQGHMPRKKGFIAPSCSTQELHRRGEFMSDPDAPHIVHRSLSMAEDVDPSKRLGRIEKQRVQNSETGGSAVTVYQGILWKRGHFRKNWKKRYFLLKWTFHQGYVLTYHSVGSSGGAGKECRGTVRLGRHTCIKDHELRPYGIWVNDTSGGYSDLFLSAASEREKEQWKDLLDSCLHHTTFPVRKEPPPPPPPPPPPSGEKGDEQYDTTGSTTSTNTMGDTDDDDDDDEAQAPSTKRINEKKRSLKFEQTVQDKNILKKYPSQLRIYIGCGKNLGISSAYGEAVVRCFVGTRLVRTRIGEPHGGLIHWEETIGPIALNGSERYAVIDVVDEHTSKTNEEARFIGRAVVPLSAAWYKIPPQWITLGGRNEKEHDKLYNQSKLVLQLSTDDLVCPPIQATFEHIRGLACLRPSLLNPLFVCGLHRCNSDDIHVFEFAANEIVEDACCVILKPFSESSGGVFPGTLFLTDMRLMFIPSSFVIGSIHQNQGIENGDRGSWARKTDNNATFKPQHFHSEAERTFVTVDNQTGFQSHGLMMAFSVPLALISRVKYPRYGRDTTARGNVKNRDKRNASFPVLKVYTKHFALPRFTVLSEGMCSEHDVRNLSQNLGNDNHLPSHLEGFGDPASAKVACCRIYERLRYQLFVLHENEEATVRPDNFRLSVKDHQYPESMKKYPLRNFSHIYDIHREFARQCVSPRYWRLSEVNRSYEVSPTYPPLLMVPKRIEDEDIKASARFRSRGRLPVLTWHHPANGAVIMRSAQPLVGLRRKSCEEDEKLMKLAGEASPRNGHRLVILDARPPLNARANTAMGKGTEKTGPGTGYPNCHLIYMGIGNIHVVRRSLEEMKKLIRSSHERLTIHSESRKSRHDPARSSRMLNTEEKKSRKSMFSKIFSRHKTSGTKSHGDEAEEDEENAECPYDTASEASESLSEEEEDGDDDADLDEFSSDHGIFSVDNPVDMLKVEPPTEGQNEDTEVSRRSVSSDLHKPATEQRCHSVFSISSKRKHTRPSKTSERIYHTAHLGPAVDDGLHVTSRKNRNRLTGSEWSTASMSSGQNRTITVEREHDDDEWASAIAGTGWFSLCSRILNAAMKVARLVDECGTSVLIHCSDGWDRTAQIASLAQIILDPYYRTIQGFSILIEKDWLSFGHKFRTRTGRDRQNVQDECPIFWQFLDCVFQILRQFPASFEFNSDFLTTVAIHAHSKWFDTFLYDTPEERHEMRTRADASKNTKEDDRTFSGAIKTPCLWKTLLSNRNLFVNEAYKPPPEGAMYPVPIDPDTVRFVGDRSSSSHQVFRRAWIRSLVLQVECSTRYTELWRSFFLHFADRAHSSLKYEEQWARPSMAFVPDEVHAVPSGAFRGLAGQLAKR